MKELRLIFWLCFTIFVIAWPKEASARMWYPKAIFYPPILHAEAVVAGKVVSLNPMHFDEFEIYKIDRPQVLSERGVFSEKRFDLEKRVIVLEGNRHLMGGPDLRVDTTQILFLEETALSKEERQRYEIENDEPVFELAPEEMSSTNIEMKKDDRHTEILEKKFGIRSAKEMTDAVSTLLSWRGIPTDDAKMAQLLQLWNKKPNQLFYRQYVPFVLTALLEKKIKPDNDREFQIQSVGALDFNRTWVHDIQLRMFANEYLKLMNEHKEDDLYIKSIPEIIARWAPEPKLRAGKYVFEVPSKDGAVQIGPLNLW